MFRVPVFEGAFSHPKIGFCGPIGYRDGLLVYDARCQTLSIQGAINWLSTTACGCCIDRIFGQYLGILGGNDVSYVWHTTVTALQIIPIEQLMEPVVFREVLAHQFQEHPGDICLDVLIIRWIEPDYISTPFNLSSCCRCCGLGCGVVSTLL